MSWAFRLFALLVLAFIGFIGYGQILDFCSRVIITRDPSLLYGALLIQGFIPAALIAAMLCYPLAKMFRDDSAFAAAAAGSPVLWFMLPGLLNWSGRTTTLFVYAYEILAYVLLLIVGTWLMHKRLAANNRNQTA